MTSNPRAGAPPGEKRDGRPMPRTDRSRDPLITTNSSNSVQGKSDDMRHITAAADSAAFHHVYALGFAAGEEVGRIRLDHELTEQDRRRMERMHGIANSPAYAALELIRWDGRREDFGKPRPGDFKGFGADYEPSQYYVPLHPGGASAHRREQGAA